MIRKLLTLFVFGVMLLIASIIVVSTGDTPSNVNNTIPPVVPPPGSTVIPSSNFYATPATPSSSDSRLMPDPVILPLRWRGSVVLDSRISPDYREFVLEHADMPSPIYVSESLGADSVGNRLWQVAKEYAADEVLAVSEENEDFFRTHLNASRETIFGKEVISLKLPAATVDAVPDALNALEKIGIVTGSPNWICHSAAPRVPNDPRYRRQWHHSMVGSGAAWSVVNSAPGTIVAVIDGGVMTSHEDLAGNIMKGWNAINGTNNVNDLDGHGTACAGVIGAVGDNAKGGVGMAWKVKIMPLRFMTNGSGYIANAIKCYDYAIENKAHILNCSFSYSGSKSSAEETAVSELRDKGIILVAAAGNYAKNIGNTKYYPAAHAADYNNVVAVAATSAYDGLSSYSNFGPSAVKIAAPGDNIQTLGITSNSAYISDFTGTSAATPVVAGALAVIRAYHNSINASTSYSSLINRMIESADVLPQLSKYVKGGRRLNLAAAVNAPATAYAESTVTSTVSKLDSDLQRVILNWSGSSAYYRVYRSTSLNGMKTAVSGWFRGNGTNSVSDYDVTPVSSYYYWVAGADDAYGYNATAFSSPLEVAVLFSDDTLLEAAPGIRLPMAAFEVRAEMPWSSEFALRPALRGKIIDETGKVFRVPLRSYAAAYPADTVYAEYRSVTHKLFKINRLKKYNNQGYTAADFLNDLNQHSLRLVMVDGLYRRGANSRRIASGYTLMLMPPLIDTHAFPTAVDTAPATEIRAGDLLRIPGERFGLRKPLVWLEYAFPYGKKRYRLPLKVVEPPRFESVAGEPAKNYTDPATGYSEVTVQIPFKWPKRFPGIAVLNCQLVVNSRIGIAVAPVKVMQNTVVTP